MERKIDLVVKRDFSKIPTQTMRKLCHQIKSRDSDVGFNNISNIVPDDSTNDSFALLAAQTDENKIIVANNSSDSDTGEPTLSNNLVDISQKEKEEASLEVEKTLQQQIPRRSCMNTHGSQKTETLTWVSHMPHCLRNYIPSDSDLRKLVKCFGGDWQEQKRVFAMLGFLEGHIHRIMKESSMLSEVILKLLFAWKYETWGKSVHTPVTLYALCLALRYVYPNIDGDFHWRGMHNIVGSILLQIIAHKSEDLEPNEAFIAF